MKTLIAVLLIIGSLFVLQPSPTYNSGKESPMMLGAVSYPTSLDSLVNPNGTDSVAAVSHSAQHSNANDAIEALEAKLGIGASTPTTNTGLFGTSAGVSVWSTAGTLVGLTTTNSTSTNYIATGSSTLQNFTFQNATGTKATTTSFFSTTASTTKFFGANLPGGTGCIGSNFLQFGGSTGLFSCGNITTALTNASTSLSGTATTTLSGLPTTRVLEVVIYVASTTPSTSNLRVIFNSDNGTNYSYYSANPGGLWGATSNTNYLNITNVPNAENLISIFIDTNLSTVHKMGTFKSFGVSSTGVPGGLTDGMFRWNDTSSRITSITVSTDSSTKTFDAGSYIEVYGR